jgi:hypothetical protein
MALSAISNAALPATQQHLGYLGPFLSPVKIATYHFDASDAGPVDSGEDWTNDANAFNENTGNWASTNGNPAALTGDGTTAPVTGSPIVSVEVRVYGGQGSTFGDLEVIVKEDSQAGATLLSRTIQNFNESGAKGWSEWNHLAPPSSGWTWQKINDLAISFRWAGVTSATLEANQVRVLSGALVYYFDASDAGPSDPSAAWLNEANAFDGHMDVTAALMSNDDSGVLSGDGTTAPTTGDTINSVYVRLRYGTTGTVTNFDMEVREDSNTGTILVSTGDLPDQTVGWSQWFRASVPSGGWTWQKVNDLSVLLDGTVPVGINSVSPFGVQVMVITDSSYDGTETDLYCVAEDTGTADKVGVFKSTDGGSNWTRQDTGNAPIVANGLDSLTAILDGGTLHIAGLSPLYTPSMTDFQDVEYYTFDLTTDTWVLDEAVVTIDINATGVAHSGLDIAVRSDGDVILLHPISDRTDMGSQYKQRGYSRREGGTWTTEIAFNAANELQAQGRCVMAPNDECHINYYVYSGTPAHYAMTLDSANSLSTRVSFSTNTTAINQGWNRPLTWDDGGTQRVLLLFTGSGDQRVRRMTEDGSGDITTDLAEAVPVDPSTNTSLAAAVDPSTKDVYFFLSGADVDLYYSRGPNGTSWKEEIELEDATSITAIWAEYYVRDQHCVIGYIVEESSTTLSYGELILCYPWFPPKTTHTAWRM